ncbi:MAG TPA: hypothetical protein PKW37_01450 [Salinivirgaceae bacterium]|nr:hypothetical protein [Salinivirgaceae bacterium]
MTTLITVLQCSTWIDNFWLPLLLIVLVIGGCTISKVKRKIKISINYDHSYWTKFEDGYYIVLNLKIINKKNTDLNDLTFETKPSHQLTDNIWSKPSSVLVNGNSAVVPPLAQIQNSLGEKPISVKSRSSIIGNLVFESTKPNCSITKLIVKHLDKNISISICDNKIEQRNIN